MSKARISFATDPGPRETTEDAAAAFGLSVPLPERMTACVGVVSDGVCGNAYGEVASDIGVSLISSRLAAGLCSMRSCDTSSGRTEERIHSLLTESFELANSAILQTALEEPCFQGMSATAVCAVLFRGIVHVAWAGDSRAYLFTRGKLLELTHDHSEVQALIDAGLVKREDANNHFLAHMITHYLGKPSGFSVDTVAQPIGGDDLLLLCTDGLTDVLSDQEISDLIERHNRDEIPFENLAGRLVQAALTAGTTDNVTVMGLKPPGNQDFIHRTLTHAYPAELARALKHVPLKEARDVQC